MRTLCRLLVLCTLGLSPVSPGLAGEPDGEAIAPDANTPQGRIKRVALSVPDLEEGIRFFRDVIGFSLDRQFSLPAGADPYLPLVFNTEQTEPLRMALFSTATEPRGLFLVEMSNMSVPAATDAANHVLVLEVPDLEALRQRARQDGFPTAEPQQSTTPDGIRFSEMLVTGPAGHRILVFQYHDR